MSKLLMLRKKEYQELARSTCTRSTRNGKLAKYKCTAYDRPRSFTYYLRHPPKEPLLPQGICYRCIEKEKQKEHLLLPLAITIYEFYYYYYACTCEREQPCASTPLELPLLLAYPRCAKLLAKDIKGRSLFLH
jgi:hypothetical protein